MAQSHWSPAKGQNGPVRRNSKPLPVAFHPQPVCSCHWCHKCVRAPTAPLGLPLPAPARSFGIAPILAFPCVLPLVPRTVQLWDWSWAGDNQDLAGANSVQAWEGPELKVLLQCHILGLGRSWGGGSISWLAPWVGQRAKQGDAGFSLCCLHQG